MALTFVKKTAPAAIPKTDPATGTVVAPAPEVASKPKAAAPTPAAPAPAPVVPKATKPAGSFLASKAAEHGVQVPTAAAQPAAAPAQVQAQVPTPAPVEAVAVQEQPQNTGALTPIQSILVDLATIQRKLNETDADNLMKAREDLKKQLAGYAAEDQYDKTKEVVFVHDGITVVFSACPKASQLEHPEKVPELLGQETFNKVASVGITDLKKYLTAAQLKTILKDVSGSRRMNSLIIPDKA